MKEAKTSNGAEGLSNAMKAHLYNCMGRAYDASYKLRSIGTLIRNQEDEDTDGLATILLEISKDLFRLYQDIEQAEIGNPSLPRFKGSGDNT